MKEILNEISFENDDIVAIRIIVTLYDSKFKPFKEIIDSWWKVMFKDSDGTFIGRNVKYDSHFSHHKIKFEDTKFQNNVVKHVLSEGDQFCYADGVTICDCKGLCREK